MLMFLISRSDDKERPASQPVSQSVLTMLLTVFPLLALLLPSTSTATSYTQATCEFQGDGTGEVVGFLLLDESETPDGTEIS